MRYIQMTVFQHGAQIFAGVVECVDLKDLPDAVAEGIRGLLRANPQVTRQAPLDALSIAVREVNGSA